MIAVLAGRRVDRPSASEVRFPPTNTAKVQQRITRVFIEEGVEVLVCGAAAGADLLALNAAGKLGLARWMVLPGGVASYRRESVVDRVGDWGPMFDRAVIEIGNNVISLNSSSTGPEKYRELNQAIFDKALELSDSDTNDVICLLVWEGKSRGSDDFTAHFGSIAGAMNIRCIMIPTLDTPTEVG